MRRRQRPSLEPVTSDVVILAGGLTLERAVSLAGASAAAAAFAENGRCATIVEVTQRGLLRTSNRHEASLKNIVRVPFTAWPRPFGRCYANLVHGELGEDGRLQSLLEVHDLRHCGSSSVALAATYDKSLYIEYLRGFGVDVPQRVILRQRLWREAGERCRDFIRRVPGPWVVKPAVGGSSEGVTLATDAERLVKAVDGRLRRMGNLIVEEYVAGTEVTVGVMGGSRGMPRAVGPVAWVINGPVRTSASAPVAAARILSAAETRRCLELAERVFAALELNGLGTVDLRLRGGLPYVIDCNAIPGLTPSSPLVTCAGLSGYRYGQICEFWLSCVNDWRPAAATA